MNISNHHHAMKEIQYISVQPKDPKFETTRITITNSAKGGTYLLSMQNPKNLKYTVIADIPVKASVGTLHSKIKGYYSSVVGSGIDINMTMYMANGTNTTNATLEASRVYHIVLKKLITGTSVSNIMVIKQT